VSDLPEYRNLIGGQLRSSFSGHSLDSVDPATGETWARIPAGDSNDVNAAVAAAVAAFPSWSSMPAASRAYRLQQVGKVFAAHGEELAQLETRDNGRLLEENRIRAGAGMAFTWNRAAEATLEAVTGQSVVLDTTTLGVTRREPYGVVAAVIPWNAPVAMLSSKASLALAAGNTVVVKPAEQACVSVLRFGELVADILPPGVLNIVSGLGPDAGQPLVAHHDVKKITMTGSSETGRSIQRAAAGALIPAIFELGGKSPNIVFADADLDSAAAGVTTESIFTGNAGQVCVAGSRILVERPILPEMLERMEAIAAGMVLGSPFDPATSMGPIVSQSQFDRVVDYLEIGKKEAQLVFGGRHGADVVPELPRGYWVEPTLFATSDNSLRICQEEIFGPVAVVIPFDTEEEAITIANDCRYGLAAGLWTRDLGRINRFVRDLESGNVWVNTYRQTRYELPFGGVKDSGFGHDTVLEFTREKAVVIAT
jgi:(Z)-2-((N-methylformamido)methylene)-5-hydroxybutyrolactone dehydrogenase